jgi:glycine/D-amino acid oxidase-like deaminating enzyme/nitrite reductase/ring-hydroxylating ferredoxin subunit
MSAPSGRHTSPWVATMTRPDLEDATLGDGRADVLVVGAGVTGLTTALLLQQEGRSVVVVDAGRLGDGVTTHSTVKVTVGHGTAYSAIASSRGREAAQAYADANQAGLRLVRELQRSLDVDCMLEDGLPHLVYAERPEQAGRIEQEAEVAAQVGLPVTLRQDAPLPFDVALAVEFADQAQFHPGQYLAGLARAFVIAGGRLVEGVRATDVDEHVDGCRVRTDAGDVDAGHVVVATQYPFLDRGGQFTQLKPRRSYGVAGLLPPGADPGMTMNVGSPTRSTRTVELEGERLLVVVGEGHPVGHVHDTAERWVRLQDWARETFGVGDFRYHWSAEEVSTLDKVPFVGRISPVNDRVLVATGFDGWGMTNGSASALMLRDLVLGRDNPWLEVFDARRAQTSLPPLREFVAQNVHVARTWLKDRVAGSPEGEPAKLRPGDAALLEVDGEQTAVHRDEQGALHAVSAVCTHMGCTVAWNAGESSWDCPCHGSRFDVDGQVLHGPASTPLVGRDVSHPQV